MQEPTEVRGEKFLNVEQIIDGELGKTANRGNRVLEA